MNGQNGYTKAERLSMIMSTLHEDGHASVADLAKKLGVTEVTIRKDLRQLNDRGFVSRTHGGAVRVDSYVREIPLNERARSHADEKRRIGKAAEELIEDTDTLIVDSGTTTLEIVRSIRSRRQVTMLTASIKIALEALRIQGMEVIMLGGTARSMSESVVGPTSTRMLRDHAVQKLFLAADGIDPTYGVSTLHVHEAELNREMIRAAERTILVADASKVGRRGVSRICAIEDIDTLIIDHRVEEQTVRQLENADVRVIVV